jgi:chromate transporter
MSDIDLESPATATSNDDLYTKPLNNSNITISLPDLFLLFLKFGLQAYGGPMAQINMLQQYFIHDHKWIDMSHFNRVLAIYQILPGPEAMELCCFFGYLAHKRIGAFIAGLGFLLPGFTFMLILSSIYTHWHGKLFEIHAFVKAVSAIKPITAALVTRGTYNISVNVFKQGNSRILFFLALFSVFKTIVGLNFVYVFVFAGFYYQILGSNGFLSVTRKMALFFVLFIVDVTILTVSVYYNINFLRSISLGIAPSPSLANLFLLGLMAGSLSFGGAYTAIPYVQNESIIIGKWLTLPTFLDGLALVSILPAPLVIFSTFVGYIGNGILGSVLMTIGIFIPAFSFTMFGHEYLERMTGYKWLSMFLDGVTAGVVGTICVSGMDIVKEAITTSTSATTIDITTTAITSTNENNESTVKLLLFIGSLLLWTGNEGIKTFKWNTPVMIISAALAGQVLF